MNVLSIQGNPLLKNIDSSIDPIFVQISQKDLTSKEVLDSKMKQACRNGFFYLEIPQDCQPLIEHAVTLGNSFYTEEKYTSLRLEGYSGYHDREHFQVESLYLEQKYWSEKMPVELMELSTKMKALGIDILKRTLSLCNIPEKEWESGTGGAASGGGQTHFTYNHYRKDKPQKGLDPHRDFGQITVLFINKKGLQARVENVWREVLPLQNHFIINFGRALETLVSDPTQLTAAWHRVPHLEEDRISFGIFIDNADESTIFTRIDGKLKSTGDSYKEYMVKGFSAYNNPEE